MAEKAEKEKEVVTIDTKTELAGFKPGREEFFAAIDHLLRKASQGNSVLDDEIKEMQSIVKKLHDSKEFKARSRPVVAATIFWWVTAKSPRAKKFWKQNEISRMFGISEVIMREALRDIRLFVEE